MKKTKCNWSRFFRRGKLKTVSSGENAQILPKEAHKEREKQKLKGIKRLNNVAGKLLKNLKVETEEMPVHKEFCGRLYLSDQAICEFIDQAKFLEACNHIYDLEQSEHQSEINIDSLYKQVEERMWSVVKEAVCGGDNMLLEPLKSVGALLKWEKEREKEWSDSVKDMESVSTWSLKYWNKNMEKLLIKCMATQIPSFVSASNTDEPALKDHLSQLETTILPNLRYKRDFFREAGLLTTYTKCYNACLSSHLSTLTDSSNLSFSKCLLVYEWSLNIYRSEKLLIPHWTPQQRLLVDAHDLAWIFSNMEIKLLSATQKEVREALREVIAMEEKPYTETTIIQVLTERSQAVLEVNYTIRDKVEAACLGELMHFLHSYEKEVRNLQLDTFSEMHSNLQILKNCCIFRAAWYKLKYLYSASADAKVKEFIDSIEEQGRELLLQGITSNVKVALKGHFRKDYSDFDKFLQCLQSSLSRFERKNTETYETLLKAVHHSIVTEYVHALLTASGKPSSAKRRKITSKIEADYRAIQTLFEECFGPSKTASLDDPIEGILEFIHLTDIDAMKIKLGFFVCKFPALRKEHLNIILDIKGTLSRADRNTVLEVVYDNCVGAESGHNLFFEEIEIKTGIYGVCGCCYCC
ncbi:exocyst complex component 3-like [Emydura macquarii macquarii]|uniref:exocyst complex component 3-like n=1 Tax=Emydura macquarii macquarii TaxID=1129001 RepID=UPI00352ACD50